MVFMTGILRKLEKQITTLDQQEKLWLLERLAHDLHHSARTSDTHMATLRDMAADPDIQRELKTLDDWDKQMLEDAEAGKLDKLVQRALLNYQQDNYREL